MRPTPNLIGQNFSRLTVLEEHRDGKILKWKCLCICGNMTYVVTASLKNGDTRSCGCYQAEQQGERATTHGYTKRLAKNAVTGARIPEYMAWCAMKTRCYNKKDKSYAQYGGRGIDVCERWLTSFTSFFEDMGRRPHNHVMDRIDVNKGYYPENCRWVTSQVSGENKRNTIWLEFNNERLTASAWARKLKVPYKRLRTRYYAGWSTQDILFKPTAREALDHKTRQSVLVSAAPSRSNIHQLPAHDVLDLSHLKKFADVELYIY